MTKLSLVSWMFTLLVATCATILSTAVGNTRLHLAVTGFVSLALALLAIRDNIHLQSAGASRYLVGASTARYLGLVWTWGALALLLSYAFILPSWREWVHFFLMFSVIGALCLFFAATLTRDAEAGRDDDTMLKLGRYLTIAQLAGMIATVVGIAIDPDKSLLIKERPDWAANHVFLYGAFAIAAISFHALWKEKKARA